MEKWVEAAYANSQQVQIAQANVALAVKEVDRARYGQFPTLDAVASANYNNQGNTPTFLTSIATTQGVVGLQFAVPLYAGGALTSRVREAVANRTKAEQDYENARRTVAQAVREAFIAVNSGLSEVKALEQAVASNKLSVEASKLGQEVGVRTQVDVLNAQSLLYDAQRNLARAYYVTIVGQLRLKQTVGRLTERDLENVNRLLTVTRSVDAAGMVAPPPTKRRYAVRFSAKRDALPRPWSRIAAALAAGSYDRFCP